jgi:dodecin
MLIRNCRNQITIYIFKLCTSDQMTSHVAKIVEIVGSSEKSWHDAAQVAVDEAKKTVRGIKGLEVQDMTAKVDPNTGNITQYRVCVKLAFGIEH